MTQEELEGLQEKALKQLKTGETLFGQDGAFAPLLKSFIEKALDSEMENHLSSDQRTQGNKRNGRGKKTIKSSSGSFEIETPQDRNSDFEPEIIKKRQTVLAESLKGKIIGLYGLGMSYRDISSHIKEMYDTSISPEVLRQITDSIIPEIQDWQKRSLEDVYCIVWLDAMHYKVREEGRVVQKAVYNIIGVDKDGKKDVLGMYVSESEGAKFWLQVLTDLNNRGVKDILIACIDNLKGFAEAIESVFPNSEVQTCIIHQIRNSLKYISYKDSKEFMRDLKKVYRAETKEAAETELLNLEEKWGKKYPVVIESWNRNWERLSTYFQYTEPIRRLIYTTNTVEGFHRQIRKVTKSKGAFASEMALKKLLYLATNNITKKWTGSIRGWSLIVQQLKIKFGERLPLKI